MAVYKEMVLDNGISATYHRVVSVNNITNKASIIEVASYVDESQREVEKEKLAKNEPMNVFIHTEYINTEYSESLNVPLAYEYLKTLDKFNGATDC